MFLKTEVRPQGEQGDAITPSRMKLSEALRRGTEPLCSTSPFTYNSACALMSAYEVASGAERGSYRWEDVARFWEHIPVRLEVMRKNAHGESRESIATWLESIGL